MAPPGKKGQRLVLHLDSLPTIPATAAAVFQVINDPSATSRDLEAAVKRDQSLAAGMLRVANSAIYGFSRSIDSVREAIVLIGVRKMRDLATSIASAGLFKDDSSGLVDAARLWRHALATACWARRVIEYRKEWSVDVAVSAALLHDLGIVVLCQCDGDRYRSLLRRAQQDTRAVHVLEEEELGITHARAGGILCAKWQLPVSLTQLISHHHSQIPPTDPAAGVLGVADYLANAIGCGPFEWEERWQPGDDYLEALGLTAADLEVLLQARKDVIDHVAVIDSIKQ